jgi:hyperosmotically inducible protein
MLQRFAMVLSAAGLAVTVACSQTDAGVTTAVKTKLAADDTVKAYEINVDTNNHVVTLTGNVDSAAAKEQAVIIARQTNGVNEVVDHIIIAPAAEATKGSVESKIDAAGHDISDAAHDSAAAVKDAAHDAKVATENAAHDAKVATEDAAHDAKVKGENAADKAGTVITDAAITSEVKTKFLADTMVSGLKIDVDTKDGVVTLNGTVKSNAEMNKAVAIARDSAGVKRVVNRLHVG